MHARFAGVAADESHIPGALENVLAGSHAEPGSPRSIRLRAASPRRFVRARRNTSLRASASNFVNAEAGYELKTGTRVQVSLLNVFDSNADDIQYACASRLRGETSDGVDDVHFHPAEPRQVRLSVTDRFR